MEALIRKHGDFEKLLDAQEEKINALDETATTVMLADHYDMQNNTRRRATVTEWYYTFCVSLLNTSVALSYTYL